MDLWVAACGAGALLLSALLGWPLTALVLRLAARSSDAGDGAHATKGTAGRRRGRHAPEPPAGDEAPDPEEPAEAPVAGPVGTAARAALRGGTWIGVLERLAVTGTLLAGYPAGLAFVVAVKGLGRYPELRENPESSERFVIGTFASMLWASAVGAVAHVLLGG